MEVVKTTTIATKRRRPKMYQDKSAALLSLMTRTLKNLYTPTRLAELIESLNERDQAMLYMHYVRPAPLEKPKDEFERLDDQSLQRLADMMTERSKRAYNE